MRAVVFYNEKFDSRKVDKLMPAITIISTIYHTEKYLPYIEECIDSVVGQSFKDYEYLIMCETNNKLDKIINKYKKNTNISFIYNDSVDFLEAYNLLGRMAKGEFLTRLDIDDYIMKEKLEKQYLFFREHPNIDVLATKGIVKYENSISEDNKKIVEQELLKANYDFDQRMFTERLLKENFIIQSSVMMRKPVFIKLKRWKKCTLDDYDFWFRAALCGFSFYRLNEYLTVYRLHNLGNTFSRSNN